MDVVSERDAGIRCCNSLYFVHDSLNSLSTWWASTVPRAVRLVCIDEFGELVDIECEQPHNGKNIPLLDNTSDTGDLSLPTTTPIA